MTTPFSFGEAFTGDVGLLMAYHNRSANTNRTVLDFAHYFTINGVFNAGGTGNLRDVITSSIDYADDANGFNGTAGVYFIASHDKDGGGGSNIGNFWIALRKGYGLIYHNAGEFPIVRVNGNPIDFPKAGGSRGDALGAFAPDNVKPGSLISTMVDIRRRFAHGTWRERWIDSDYLVLEYNGRLVYGLSDSGGSTANYHSVTVNTAFPAGVVLEELTGNATRYNTQTSTTSIPQEITVGTGGSVAMRIPYNHAQYGYVAYGPKTPPLSWNMTNVASVIPADPAPPQGSGNDVIAKRRLTPVHRITSPNSVLNVTTNGTEKAVLVNIGNKDVNKNGRVDILRGALAGFEEFTTQATGNYSMTVDWAALGDGYHYVELVGIVGGGTGQHGAVWSSERFTVLVDLETPQASFFPQVLATRVTGNQQVIVQVRTDGTEDNALVAVGPAFDPVQPINQFTQMIHAGPNEWMLPVDVTLANRTITVALFEETGGTNRIHTTLAGPGEPTPTTTATPTPTPTGTAIPTSTPTPTPIDGQAVQLPFLTAAPTLDGTVNPAEYTASSISATLTPDPTKNSFGPNNNIGTIHLANDAENLYLGLKGFKLEGQPNGIVLFFDVTVGATGNANFGVNDVGKLSDYGPTSPDVATAQEALSVALNLSPWPTGSNINFGDLTMEYGLAITGTHAQSLNGMPDDAGTIGLFGFPEVIAPNPVNDFWFIPAQFVGGTTEVLSSKSSLG